MIEMWFENSHVGVHTAEKGLQTMALKMNWRSFGNPCHKLIFFSTLS